MPPAEVWCGRCGEPVVGAAVAVGAEPVVGAAGAVGAEPVVGAAGAAGAVGAEQVVRVEPVVWAAGAVDAAHPDCVAALRLEPPRYCTACRRRMKVQVVPGGWSAECVVHGRLEQSTWA